MASEDIDTDTGADEGAQPTDTGEQVAAPRPSAPFVMPPPLRYEPSNSTEDWLLTYGDMVTLLLTLFVLLVLSASFDKKKFDETGSDAALRGVFSAVSQFSVGSIYAEDITQIAADSDDQQLNGLPVGKSVAVLNDSDLDALERREEALADIRAMLVQQRLDIYISAVVEGDRIKLDIPNSILFDVGKVELRGQGRSVLRALAPVLAKGDYIISIEGHTDSSPIDTLDFASNWELSANRAARVVRLFIETGIAPRRLEAVGYADTRPLASNATPDGRAENRRVTIKLRVGSTSGDGAGPPP